MKKKMLLLILSFNLIACGELQQVINQLPQDGTGISNIEIAQGLREALNMGIEKQVSKLTLTDGFYKNDSSRSYCPRSCKKLIKP